jgi:hypothetical protein
MILRQWALVMGLSMPVTATAAALPDIFQYPVVHSTKLTTTTPVDEDLFNDKLAQLLTRLETQDDVLWIGYPWQRVVVAHSGREIYAYYTFLAKDAEGSEKLRQTVADLGFSLSYDIEATQVFASPIVWVRDAAGREAACTAAPHLSFPSWTEAFTQLQAQARALSGQSAEAIRQFLHEELACDIGDIDIKEVDFLMDLAAREDCPLSSETLSTCFIARGWFKEVANF